jgi:hypothetical protein
MTVKLNESFDTFRWNLNQWLALKWSVTKLGLHSHRIFPQSASFRKDNVIWFILLNRTESDAHWLCFVFPVIIKIVFLSDGANKLIVDCWNHHRICSFSWYGLTTWLWASPTAFITLFNLTSFRLSLLKLSIKLNTVQSHWLTLTEQEQSKKWNEGFNAIHCVGVDGQWVCCFVSIYPMMVCIHPIMYVIDWTYFDYLHGHHKQKKWRRRRLSATEKKKTKVTTTWNEKELIIILFIYFFSCRFNNEFKNELHCKIIYLLLFHTNTKLRAYFIC